MEAAPLHRLAIVMPREEEGVAGTCCPCGIKPHHVEATPLHRLAIVMPREEEGVAAWDLLPLWHQASPCGSCTFAQVSHCDAKGRGGSSCMGLVATYVLKNIVQLGKHRPLGFLLL